jgi:3-hydroxyacyl-[acyl-carrier-protein] dehydratase
MEREEIKKFLAHREPMLLVDRMEFDEEGNVHGEYKVKGDEFFLQGHFPGHPTVPGVILCEIMGQCSSLLVKDELAEGRTPFFTGMDGVRFKNSVFPGDLISITGHITNHKAVFYYIEAKATVEGKLCASATFSFALIDNSKLK